MRRCWLCDGDPRGMWEAAGHKYMQVLVLVGHRGDRHVLAILVHSMCLWDGVTRGHPEHH